MARIVFGSIATEIRGSVGGQTFQKNRYGFTLKNKSNPGNQGTIFQKPNRDAIYVCTQGWKKLSEFERSQWNTFASTYPQSCKHNSSAYLSGYNLFLKHAILLTIGAGEYVQSPSLTIPDLPVFTPQLFVGVDYLNFNDYGTPSSPNLVQFLYISPPVNQSDTFVGSKCRRMLAYQGQATTQNVVNEYITNFGRLPQPGDYVFATLLPFGYEAPWFYTAQTFKLQVQSE